MFPQDRLTVSGRIKQYTKVVSNHFDMLVGRWTRNRKFNLIILILEWFEPYDLLGVKLASF